LSAAWIRNSEQYGSRDLIDSRTGSAGDGWRRGFDARTFIDLHICDRLPFVHSHKPSIALPSAAEINDKLLLVAAQSSQYGVEAFLRELPGRKQEGRDDDLLLQLANIHDRKIARLNKGMLGLIGAAR
jgi:hypothetical protein